MIRITSKDSNSLSKSLSDPRLEPLKVEGRSFQSYSVNTDMVYMVLKELRIELNFNIPEYHLRSTRNQRNIHLKSVLQLEIEAQKVIHSEGW